MTGLEIAGYTVFAIGVAAAIFFGITAIMRFVAEKKEDESKTIRQPKMYMVVGVCGTAIMLFAISLAMFVPSISSNTKEERFVASMLLSFILYLNEVVGIIGTTWKVELKEDCFYYTNMFAIKKRYGYDEVRFKYINAGYRVYKGKRYITTMTCMQENYDALEKTKRAYDKNQKVKRA